MQTGFFGSPISPPVSSNGMNGLERMERRSPTTPTSGAAGTGTYNRSFSIFGPLHICI